MNDARRIEVDANGIHFHAFEQGQGPLMLLLHGFPDDATTWRGQMPVLAEAGYRVVAPYMRGYAPTSAPADGNYQTAALGRDVAGLIDALSPDAPAVVFGHDWGAISAYAGALKAPDRIERLITSAVPYGPGLIGSFATNYAQQKRSFYVFLFQLPIAEEAVAADGLRFIRNLWHDWSPDWDFGEEDIREVLETLGRPGVVEAAIGYYRCLFDPARMDITLMDEQAPMNLAPIEVPTLYVHGNSDGCMAPDLADGMADSFPKGLTSRFIEGTGHFVHREKPNAVNSEILKFLGK